MCLNLFFHRTFAFAESEFRFVDENENECTTSNLDPIGHLSEQKIVELLNGSVELEHCKQIINKLQDKVKAKSREIKNLKRMLRYYSKSDQKRTKIVENLNQNQDDDQTIPTHVCFTLM